MGKRYKDTDVRCPFYHSEDAQHIYCDGPQENTWLHLSFQSSEDRKSYKKSMCRKACDNCMIYKMLESIE